MRKLCCQEFLKNMRLYHSPKDCLNSCCQEANLGAQSQATRTELAASSGYRGLSFLKLNQSQIPGCGIGLIQHHSTRAWTTVRPGPLAFCWAGGTNCKQDWRASPLPLGKHTTLGKWSENMVVNSPISYGPMAQGGKSEHVWKSSVLAPLENLNVLPEVKAALKSGHGRNCCKGSENAVKQQSVSGPYDPQAPSLKRITKI